MASLDTALLAAAREEILSLRRRNEVLQAKVDMIDLFTTVLFTKPHAPTMGMAEDVAWKLGREIERVEAEKDAE